MRRANGAHSVFTLSVRVTHCPPPPVARKFGYPSWKVIVSAYMANTSSRARKSPAFFARTTDHNFVHNPADQSSRTRASRSALAITLTEDSAIAAAPSIGDSRMPNHGYSAPAAIGTPAAL